MPPENEIRNVKTVLQVDTELLESINGLIENEASQSLLNIFADLHSADIAEIINRLDLYSAKYTFSLLDSETAAEVILDIDESQREKILKDIDVKTISNIVEELYSDDATDIVSDLPEPIARQVLKNIDKEDSEDLKELLKYPEDSAGGIMTSNFVYVTSNATIKDAIEEVRKNAEEFEHIYQIYVLKENDELVGTVTLKSLLVNPLNVGIKSVMQEDLIFVTTDMDQEEVANIMHKYGLVTIPVVDEHRRMLGRITFDDIQDVIHEEASEDIQKIAGLTEEEEISYSAFRVSRNRLPWLFVSLSGELISAVVLASFQASIEQIIIASFFIPIVMAMGGSAGSQSAIVMVQAINAGEIWENDTFKRLIKELRVAFINSIACTVALLLLTYFIFRVDLNFAYILSASLFIIMVNATMVGAIVPVILNKLNIDPAIATGPFVATTNDIIGLIIYFSLLTLFIFK
ncbi:MAG: magnesium transporter [Ignavibacteriales bacterium]|nr:magnesium transporter [Ignavibacteriales bacterium]MBK7981701.1 magnesium transporter [Ignavibacteriota bacterium]